MFRKLRASILGWSVKKKIIVSVIIVFVLSFLLAGGASDVVIDEAVTSGDAVVDTKPVQSRYVTPPSGNTGGGLETKPGVVATNAKVVPKGSRRLVVDVNESSNPDAYGDHIEAVSQLGASQVGLFLSWNVIEPEVGVHDKTYIDISNSYYPTVGFSIDLTIAVVNTTERNVPADLNKLAWDDPVMIARFKDHIDYLASNITFDVSSINVGSEYDILFGSDKKEWQQFINFFNAVVPHIKKKFPGVILATEPTYFGMKGPGAKYIKELNNITDVVAISYYGLKENGNVEEPDIVHSIFADSVAMYPGRKIWFYQFGYPTSSVIKSSEKKQADFYRETFVVWDKYSEEIEMVAFTWLHDLSEQQAIDTGSIYGSTAQKFTEFLRTLGLRSHTETEKEAYGVIRSEAKKRGW